VWQTSIKRFRKDLEDDGTDPKILEAIYNGLLAWRNGIPLDYTNYNPAIQELIERQNKMGWGNFFEGRAVIGWSRAQETFFKQQKSMRSGKRWLSMVIRKLFDIAWDFWEHRNGIVHTGDTAVILDQLRKDADLEAAQEHGGSREVKTLIRKYQKDRNRNKAWLRAWLHRVRTARQRFAERGGRNLDLQRAMMARHFIRRTTTTTAS
jgi:hypothetical protein